MSREKLVALEAQLEKELEVVTRREEREQRTETILQRLESLVDHLAQHQPEAAVINVPAPVVHVPAPVVNVEAPIVKAPQMAQSRVKVEMPERKATKRKGTITGPDGQTYTVESEDTE